MKSVIKLKIADIIIELKSKFEMAPLDRKESFRFANFIYKGFKKADISLEVRFIKDLPKLNGLNRLFLTVHPQTKQDNWAIFKNKKGYVVRNYIDTKLQHVELNRDFNRGIVLLPNNGLVWKLQDIIYDALQIILVHYITTKDGLFVHAVGLKDIDKKGLLFVGKSGDGKSTTARLWHKFSKAKVLNDDRIIIREDNSSFLMHSSPWHGDFSDYLVTKVGSAKIKSIFFLSHGKVNSAKRISAKRAFNLLFPCLFATFWDREGLAKAIKFSQNLLKKVSCFKLAFRNDKEVIGFVRTLINTN